MMQGSEEIPHGYVLGILMALASVGLDPAYGQTSPEQITEQHRALYEQFAREMLQLADSCQAQGFGEAAGMIRHMASPPWSHEIDYDDLPRAIQPELSPALPDAELAWRAKLRGLRRQYAVDLYRLALSALKQRQGSEAFHLIRESAYHDPDNPTTRKMLGYIRVHEEWLTPFEAQMRHEKKIWDDRFGWIKKDYLPRYEAGERLNGSRWISAEKDAAIRTSFRKGWTVESENFVIKTNHSLERAAELSSQLERFHRFFLLEFADFFQTPQQMRTLLGTGPLKAKSASQKHQVWYFRSRDEFIRMLSNKQPGVKYINGLYLPKDRRAYFFATDDDSQANMETLFHEVTHQILSESSMRTYDIATEANFWVVEGIACYMESFRPGNKDHPARVGDPRHPRLYWARHRLVDENWFMPLEQFTALGMREFQFPPDLPTAQRYYSQATGLTHFLLHAENGRYRDRFVQYLSAIYSPDRRVRTNVPTLETILKEPFSSLDKKYKAYISDLPTD